MIRQRLRELALMAITASFCFGAATAQAGRFYKWIDENGQVRYGDRVPPEYAKKRNETLNDQGIVVQTTPAQKTPEQIAEEERLRLLQEEQLRKQRELAYKNRILLDTFSSEDEMILTRDGKIEAVDAVIRVTQGRIEKAKRRLANLMRRAANLERSGRPVSPELAQGIADTRQQIQQNLRYIDKRKQEQDDIRAIFAQDIDRFRELKAKESRADVVAR